MPATGLGKQTVAALSAEEGVPNATFYQYILQPSKLVQYLAKENT